MRSRRRMPLPPCRSAVRPGRKCFQRAARVQPLSPIEKALQRHDRRGRGRQSTTRNVARGPSGRAGRQRKAQAARRTGSGHSQQRPCRLPARSPGALAALVEAAQPCERPEAFSDAIPWQKQRGRASRKQASKYAADCRSGWLVRAARRHRRVPPCVSSTLRRSPCPSGRAVACAPPTSRYFAKSYSMSLMSAIFGACSGIGASLLDGFW